MLNSVQIRSEIEAHFEFLPPLFAVALSTPSLLESFWQQTLFSYIHNPLPKVLKEKFFVYLSRQCDIPYTLVCHSCTLHPLGVSAQKIRSLVQLSPPSSEDPQSDLNCLKNGTWQQEELDEKLEISLIRCCGVVFLHGEQTEQTCFCLRQFFVRKFMLI